MKTMQSAMARTAANDGANTGASVLRDGVGQVVGYALLGIYFGIVLVKGQVADWFRIQQMFHLQQFYMFGVIGSAVVTAMAGLWIVRRLDLRSRDGEPLRVPVKPVHKGQLIGGILFGLGWAATGACPGPIYAQLGAGHSVVLVTLFSALAGTWAYGRLRHRLPH